jgi:gamma-glutamylaminecyclotransferase
VQKIRYKIPGNFINGEIYEVDEPMFAVLDKLEDYPNWYDRQILDMATEDGNKIPCWIYMLKSFPEKMLQLNFLSNYESKGDMKYVERSKRTVSPRDDLEYGIN